MAEFSFIEITYDPFINDKESVYDSLKRIGFTHRSQHAMDFVGFWSLRKCIIMLREDNTNTTPAVTGLGFIGDVDDITNLIKNYKGNPKEDFDKLKPDLIYNRRRFFEFRELAKLRFKQIV